jgi:hypothetical protein
MRAYQNDFTPEQADPQSRLQKYFCHTERCDLPRRFARGIVEASGLCDATSRESWQGRAMRHARIAAIGMACVAAAACASPVNAYDAAKGQRGLARAFCFAGRLGRPLDETAKSAGFDDPKDLPDVVKNVWEGCRQESVKDFSCYPYIINEEDNSRTIFMPGNAPSNALYEPWTADCRGRVGRWPAWRDAKEDPTETERMGVFYANNPPGELKAPSR